MPDNSSPRGAYVFQGNTLVLPEAADHSPIPGPVPPEKILEAFAGTELFEIPRIEGPGTISAADLPPERPLPAGWKALPVRQALSLMTGGIVDGSGPPGRILRAFHIAQWRRESAFCGSCGSRNHDAPAEFARLCPVCGRLEFPRISPAVIVLIVNRRGEALLAHNKKFASGVYSLIAGFNEAGESLEATAAREIREEVGLEVGEIRYAASQPWPFPNSLMLGFSARHVSGEIRPDGIEIEDAQWFPRDKLPLLPGGGSVSRYLINRWVEGKLV